MRAARPVPPVSLPTIEAAPEIGRALVASLCEAHETYHGWALRRMPNGGFFLRAWRHGGSNVRQVGLSGPLLSILGHQGDRGQFSPARRSALGLPASGAETATVGALTLALFATQRGTGSGAWLDFRPWAATHLRYRLRLPELDTRGKQTWHRLHASALEPLLAAGAAYLSSPVKR
jgi:hypothetical protein